ncbi:MAG: ice-binding family protein [Planctomycetota bacterium]
MKLSNGLAIYVIGLCLVLSPSDIVAAVPTFTSTPTISGALQVGYSISIGVAATDPQGLPLAITYNYGDGTSDTLGKHTYFFAGIYPIMVTISNGVDNATTTLSVTIKQVANLWIKKQTINGSVAGNQSWHAKYIYNSDRTRINIFNPAIDTFSASLGTIPIIQILSDGIGAPNFFGTTPKLTFKSTKGSIPNLGVILDQSNQAITINGTAETYADTPPGVFSNTVQLGVNGFTLDQAFDANGVFSAITGYRSAAFVVSGASIKVGRSGKDSATINLLLGDPAFTFPGALGVKTLRVRMTNVMNQIVFDENVSNAVVSKSGKIISGKSASIPTTGFNYNSSSGVMTFKLSKATLSGLLITSEEYVRVDVTLGDQTYTTRVTLFTSGCGKFATYSTKMPAKFCNFIPGSIPDITAPIVLATVPAKSATSIAINSKITVTFNEAMNLSTLNAATFVLVQGATVVPGTLTYAANGTAATFTPSSNLANNTPFTATVTTGAKDLAGNALAANFVWNFTTSATVDTTPPNAISTNPADQTTQVTVNHTVNATFDESIDIATINSATFTLAGPGPNPITGTVAYDAINKIATFTPGSDLAPNTQFMATITTEIKDLAGNALAVNKVWVFTTGTQQTLPPVTLGMAAPYGTFGGGSGMTNEGILTVVNGDIGSTGAATTVTGFHDSTGDIYTETPLNQGQVNGRIYTGAPPPAHPGGLPVGGNSSTLAIATQAAAAANTAYNNLSPASMPGGMDPGAGQLGGLTLAPGIYKAAGATFLITGSDLTLDAQGDVNAIWVFQMAASLTVGAPGAPRSVIMINGAQPKNVFWYVGSAATINGAGGGTMVGTIIASSGVTFSTAGNATITTLNGRALSLNASTTLVNTVINVPAP